MAASLATRNPQVTMAKQQQKQAASQKRETLVEGESESG